MNTAQFIRFAADITEHGKPCGCYHDYVENVVEPYSDQAADYYGAGNNKPSIGAFILVEYAYKIAHDLDTIGCVVIPETLTD